MVSSPSKPRVCFKLDPLALSQLNDRDLVAAEFALASAFLGKIVTLICCDGDESEAVGQNLIVHDRTVFKNHDVLDRHHRDLGEDYAAKRVGKCRGDIREDKTYSVLFFGKELYVHLVIMLPTRSVQPNRSDFI